MGNAPLPPLVSRFGVFEVDHQSGELRKQGKKVRIVDQSFLILLALLDRPGEVVTRQQLHQRLWPGDTFVDFDANLNTAVSLLREALGDSARNPRFIETLPRRGYRFLGAVTDPAASPPTAPAVSLLNRRIVITLASVGAMMLSGLSYWYVVSPPQRIASLAVLPFVYAGPAGQGDQDYLADGMTSALIMELARLGVPNVISETSVMRYKGIKKPLPSIARELGADVLVEGSVMREGNTVRVNAQLIDARTDKHLWAKSYQQELHSILALRDEIAGAIVREIRIVLAPSELVQRAIPRPVNPQAHEAYLKGRYALRSEIEERRSASLEFFAEAIRLDPTFAPAYQGLADYYGFTDAVPPAEALASARRYALKALELDGGLAAAHLSLALASMWGDWDWAAAEREFQQSLDLDRGDATTRRWYALFLDLTGRPRAAFAQLQRVRELDPVSPETYHALAHHFFLARRHGEAVEQMLRARELSPHDPKVSEGLGSLYLYTGAYERAIAATEDGIALWGRDPAFIAALAVAHARAGAHGKAKELLNELQGVARQRHIPPCWFAMIHMNLGEFDRAMDWLEAAFKTRDAYLVQLKVSPMFDLIRDNPRFPGLLRRMNFPQDDSRSEGR